VIDLIISAFEAQENREVGVQYSNYMKDRFPFFGVRADPRKTIQKQFFPLLNEKYTETSRWEFVRELWEKPERELHYFALDWVNSFKPKTYRKEDIDEIYFLLTNQTWWDSVDSLASNILAKYNKQFPEMQKVWLEDWRDSDNFWLKRSCIIHQLKYKTEVDFDLLKNLIKENLHDQEFFIQKAIGWSLRQYGKFNPEAVVEFVNEINLTGLAKREALKHILNKDGTYKRM
jgi:3-methyladenine DNA glycosylase AlkD